MHTIKVDDLFIEHHTFHRILSKMNAYTNTSINIV